MAWARLDDAMAEHRKTRKVLRTGGLAAFGLHTLGILHSSRYLLDGHLDPEFLEEAFDLSKIRNGGRERLTGSLADAGMWVPGDDGWTIHDYLKYNPSREKVIARRDAEAQRKADQRAAVSA